MNGWAAYSNTIHSSIHFCALFYTTETIASLSLPSCVQCGMWQFSVTSKSVFSINIILCGAMLSDSASFLISVNGVHLGVSFKCKRFYLSRGSIDICSSIYLNNFMCGWLFTISYTVASFSLSIFLYMSAKWLNFMRTYKSNDSY